jgi:hypothetical protein
MAFNVGGLQYFGKLDISSNGVSATPTLTEIYNNTGQTFAGSIIVASPSAFTIQASFNWADYNYSVTFTPINLVQATQTLIPYYILQSILTPSTLAISLNNWEGNDFIPNAIDDAISYYINIRLT